jgi:diguanylate cyclase (GGDEF)-like protein
MVSRKPNVVWAAQALAGLALLAHALHGVLNLNGGRPAPVFDQWIYDGLMLSAAVLCLARAIWWRPARLSWFVFSSALFFWAAGDITWTVLSAGGEPPYPSLADAFNLGFYVAAYAGLVLLLRARGRGLGLSIWMDGLIASAAAAAVGAAVLFEVVLDATGGTPAEVVTNLAYPLGDILLFALVVGAFAMAGWRPSRDWALIGAGLIAMSIADGIYLFQVSAGSYVEGSILDSLWPASALLLALAAWQPPRPTRPVDLEGRSLLIVPVFLGAVGVGVLAYDHFVPLNDLAAGLAVATLLGVVARTALTFRENQRLLARTRGQAVSDELTGLGNRRRLLADLESAVRGEEGRERSLLLLFDLDGFKGYNDTYGHPVGDALLTRLGRALEAAVGADGRAYRLGGDEFCVLARVSDARTGALIDACVEALTERSEGFAIGTSFGVTFLPDEGPTPSEALRTADRRLYAQKQERRLERGRQPEDVLLRAMYEREPRLHEHARNVSALALAVGNRLGLAGTGTAELARAAELHDIGKLAVPDAILYKPGLLDSEEQRFIRNHSAIGERILAASPVLAPVSRLVRATHERWGGQGYPDGLTGSEIPLGARIIAVCDAFVAMISVRPHQDALGVEAALAELRRCVGTQFDPSVVDAFFAVIAEQPELLQARRQSEQLTPS